MSDVKIKVTLDTAVAKRQMKDLKKEQKGAIARAVERREKRKKAAPSGVRSAVGSGVAKGAAILGLLFIIVKAVQTITSLIEQVQQAIEEFSTRLAKFFQPVADTARKVQQMFEEFRALSEAGSAIIGAKLAFSKTGAQVDAQAIGKTVFEQSRRAMQLEKRQTDQGVVDAVRVAKQTLGYK